jgi:hypothetical protein
MFNRYTPHAIIFGIGLIVVLVIEVWKWALSLF